MGHHGKDAHTSHLDFKIKTHDGLEAPGLSTAGVPTASATYHKFSHAQSALGLPAPAVIRVFW